MNILIIDDNINYRKSIKKLLEKFGHKVMALGDEEGLIDAAIREMNKAKEPGAVLLDYDLGSEVTGLHYLNRYWRRFEKIKWYANSSTPEHCALLMENGCVDIIGKDCDVIEDIFFKGSENKS